MTGKATVTDTFEARAKESRDDRLLDGMDKEMRANAKLPNLHTVTPQELAEEKVISVFSDYPGNFYAIMSTGRIFRRGGTLMAPTWSPIAAPLEGKIVSTSISVQGVIYAVTDEGRIFERKPNPQNYDPVYEFKWFEIVGPVVG